jgi:prolipoprotein diacylglyceryltransferase
MWILWKKRVVNVREGFYTGWLFVLVFSFRFVIEWLKLPQTTGASPDAFLSTGQLLSIPFILAGLFLLLRKNTSPQVVQARH